MVLNHKHTSPSPHPQARIPKLCSFLWPTLSPAGSKTFLLLLGHAPEVDSHLQTAYESLIHRLTLSDNLFAYSQDLHSASLWPCAEVPLTLRPCPQAAFPSPILLGTLTCRPSSRAMPRRVVSGGALAGVAVLQASCASLKSRDGEWIFCWMEPNTACSHLGSPGVGGETETLMVHLHQTPTRHCRTCSCRFLHTDARCEHGGTCIWQIL